MKRLISTLFSALLLVFILILFACTKEGSHSAGASYGNPGSTGASGAISPSGGGGISGASGIPATTPPGNV